MFLTSLEPYMTTIIILIVVLVVIIAAYFIFFVPRQRNKPHNLEITKPVPEKSPMETEMLKEQVANEEYQTASNTEIKEVVEISNTEKTGDAAERVEEENLNKLSKKEDDEFVNLSEKYETDNVNIEDNRLADEVMDEDIDIPEELSDDELKELEAPITETKKPKPEEKVEKPELGKYHILYRKDDNKWYVKREGSDKTLRVLGTQQEAIAWATIKALNQDTTIVIHKRDGKIRKQNY